MAIIADPVEAGLVNSLGQPGGNLTGLAFQNQVLTTKRLELLTKAFPTPLASEASVGLERQWGRLHPGRIGGADAPASHATARQAGSGPSRERVQRRHSRPGRSPPGPGVAVPQREPEDRGRPRRPPTPLPATYEAKTFAEIGGLMSHGPSFSDTCTAASRRSWTDPERGEASRPSGRAANKV